MRGFPIKQFSLWLTAMALLCTRPESVNLKIDFSTRPSWHFAVSANVSGHLAGDSAGAFEGGIDCLLAGTGLQNDPAFLRLTVDSVTIRSTTLDAIDLMMMEKRLKSARFEFGGPEGAIDRSDIPNVAVGGWDICRHFMRLVPQLPRTAVRPGASWDRTISLPMESATASGHTQIYQALTFDSLVTGAEGRRLACLSWRFSQQANATGDDTAAIIGKLPQNGTGTGSAILDISENSLVRASMVFRVSSPAAGGVAILWEEHAEVVAR